MASLIMTDFRVGLRAENSQSTSSQRVAAQWKKSRCLLLGFQPQDPWAERDEATNPTTYCIELCCRFFCDKKQPKKVGIILIFTYCGCTLFFPPLHVYLLINYFNLSVMSKPVHLVKLTSTNRWMREAVLFVNPGAVLTPSGTFQYWS